MACRKSKSSSSSLKAKVRRGYYSREYGLALVHVAVSRAVERLHQYQTEKAMEESMEEDGFGVPGGFSGGRGGGMFGDTISTINNSMGGGTDDMFSNVSEFLTSMGPVGGMLAFSLGMVQAAMLADNGNAKLSESEVPDHLDDDDLQAYQDFLIEELGHMAFQDGGWSWTPADMYVKDGGFYNGDTGESILGILCDGQYYYGNQ